MTQNEQFLVTGAEGFIGSHVVSEISARGYGVDFFDKKGGDSITSPLDVSIAVGFNDHVIHCAGLLGTSELFDDVFAAIDTNIGGMATLLQALRKKPGPKPTLTIIDQPHIWVNPYETTKEAAVKLAVAYSAEFGIPLSIVRTYNAFGPGQAVGPGHPRKLIPTASYAAWRGEPIVVNGSGEQGTDLVWVGDVAELLADGPENAVVGGSLVEAGTGHAFTVNEVVETICDHVEYCGFPRPEVLHGPSNRGEQDVPFDLYHSRESNLPFRLDKFIETVNSYAPDEIRGNLPTL